tara:strand:+ start:361 stop:1770 length:1410 start_codon:yes stop_codon:yes gene_type:complete
MFFHSLPSLLIFLPLIFSFYPLFKIYRFKFAKIFLLIFSIVFYGFDIPWFIIPLLISAFSDFIISRILITDYRLSKFQRIFYLSLSLIINIGLLFLFKYYDLFIDTFKLNSFGILKSNNLLLPAGISFYTFQTLSFTIDSFKKKIFFKPNFLDYLLFVCYFPQLVAGPILRPNQFFDNKGKPLLSKKVNLRNSGFTRICYGLFLKLCLADQLAFFNDRAFDGDYLLYSSIDSITMAFGFGLQIYFDFSAYSHMAIGISEIIGLPISENFKFPYNSKSVTEFWRKWHISLSSWVKDYLYTFLKIKIPNYLFSLFPLLLTWTIMGLWHGASWRFAIWGALNSIFIFIHRIYKSILDKYNYAGINSLFSWILSLISIMSSWIYFRSSSWEQANHLFRKFYLFNSFELNLENNYYILVFAFSFLCLFSGFIFNIRKFDYLYKSITVRLLSSSFLLAFAIIFINNQSSFIYFQF